MSGPRIVVLGAGPTGLGAALGLAERGFAVDVLERRDVVGGLAGSFELAGLRVDYGSHRLHPAADPSVLARLRDLLGSDLLERPRHGRILLGGRWIHFPLRPVDLALRAPPRFALGVAGDMVGKLWLSPTVEEETFASVLERGLGRTICRDFYFPYARKIWGLEPEQISPIQARKRVSAASLGKLVRRLLPGTGTSGGASRKGVFYYPRQGYGQISESLHEAAIEAGAQIRLSCPARRIRRLRQGGFEIGIGDDQQTLRADRLWSTIPISVLARLLDPAPAAEVLRSAEALEQRAMVLVYLVLAQDRFTEYDAHYFPGPEIPMTRLSEPKNYAARDEPRGRTVLCAEIPCFRDDATWSLADDELQRRVLDGLATAGLPVESPCIDGTVRRLANVYPIYRRGYEAHLEPLDDSLKEINGLLTFGRQGLFAHDNTHHGLFSAGAAVDCLQDDGGFDLRKWARYREVFESHVVED